MVISDKGNYYNNLGSKLNNPRTYCKTYWSLLKVLINGRRVYLIPLIQTDDKYITNFTEKLKHLTIIQGN